MPVKGVRLHCNASKYKSCYRNKNAKVRLYSLSFVICRMNLTKGKQLTQNYRSCDS